MDFAEQNFCGFASWLVKANERIRVRRFDDDDDDIISLAHLLSTIHLLDYFGDQSTDS